MDETDSDTEDLENKEDEDVPRNQRVSNAINIDMRDSLIIDNDCRRVMRNLRSLGANMAEFNEAAGEVTQPSFLSPEDRVLFFKTKMFYLLQERQNLKESIKEKIDGIKVVKKFADAYPTNLSPFGDSETKSGPGVKKRRTEATSKQLTTPAGPMSSGRTSMHKRNAQKTGIDRFLENIRTGNQSVLHMLDEKIRKTIQGTGYASLIGDKDIKKMDILLAIFPDFNLLMADGRDEESKLNNLISHVQTRVKAFDKLQSFFEHPASCEEYMAHMFTITNQDTTEIRPEIAILGTKRLFELDEKKIHKLFAVFKDEYSSAKTTIIADGTETVVLNRKKQDRIKNPPS